jgi:spore coat protein A, manganese oxidase
VKLSRRILLKQMLIGAPAAWAVSAAGKNPRTILDPNQLKRFVDPLPMLQLARSTERRPDPERPGHEVPFYRMHMRMFQMKVHRDIPPTTFFGYEGMFPGPTIEAFRDQAIQVEWINQLPLRHLLPIDHTLCGAEPDKPDVRTVVHLHGAKVASESDGYPESWFVPGQSATCFYPNSQPGATLFYHDHAMGITRLNAIAGLAGMYLIRDPQEDSLTLPRDRYEVPLVICDRTFSEDGALYYRVSTDPAKPWIPEFFGNAILVNGKLFPYLDVEPGKYRFRILNAANAGFYDLSVVESAEFDAKKLPIYQIGSDQGFLAAPVELETLNLAPAERADFVVDFAAKRNQFVYLRTNATVMLQFRVSDRFTGKEHALPPTLDKLVRLRESEARMTRELTLDDFQDRTGHSHLMLLNKTRFAMPITEKPQNRTSEIWSFVNLTDDTPPIHLHNVRFQLLDRRQFDLQTYFLNRQLVYTGSAVPPEPGEAGWKDTIRAFTGQVTRIIVPFDGYTGRYVWHCHLLEHEDNEMMRPYEILA